MANITRIKAKDAKKPSEEKAVKPPKKSEAVAKSDKEAIAQTEKTEKQVKKAEKQAKKAEKKQKKSTKKPFILFRPFVAFGRYLRGSWKELRQVRWPNRKATWKMTLAVLIYCGIFLAFIVALDALFTLIFNNILG